MRGKGSQGPVPRHWAPGEDHGGLEGQALKPRGQLSSQLSMFQALGAETWNILWEQEEAAALLSSQGEKVR